MSKSKKTSPVNNLESVQYIFCVECENTVERKGRTQIEDSSVQMKLMEPFYKVKREKPINISFNVDENGVFSYSDPFCKHCHSHKVTKHGYNSRNLINEDGEHVIVKVQRYYCPVCGKYSQTEFKGEYENYCNFSNETKKQSIKVREISWYPFRKLKELYKFFCGIEISHETVRKAQIVTNNLYYLNEEIQPSGFYGYDVQWEHLDDGFHYRHLLFDLVNNAPVAELLAPDEELKTTYDFINKSLKPIERTGIVTDLKPGYDTVMQKLGFKHQHCTYHLRLAVNQRIKKYLKEKDLELRLNTLKENERISKSKLDELVENKIKELKSEINIYKQLIFELFNQQTYDKALNYMDMLKQEFINFPEILQKFLEKDLFPEYKKYIWFLKKEYKGKLTRTDNDSEMYFHATLPKSEKKRFRTEQGIFNQIFNRKNGWMKKIKSQLTK